MTLECINPEDLPTPSEPWPQPAPSLVRRATTPFYLLDHAAAWEWS
jgi:hypothetical protein